MAACRRAVVAGDAERAAGALDGAWAAINLQGPFKAGVDLAQGVCAMPALRGRAAAHAHAQVVLGGALEALGQRVQAMTQYEEALVHARAAADVACEAAATIRLGILRARAGQADAAREAHGRALLMARQLGDGALECAALNGLGDMVSSLFVGYLLSIGRSETAFGAAAACGALGVVWLLVMQKSKLTN